MSILSGTKFYRYIENQENPEIIRVYNIPSQKMRPKDSVIYLDEEGNKNRMSLGYLNDNYKMLKPDGVIIFTIVTVMNGPDVIVALQDTRSGHTEPYAICRQSIYDTFSNITNTNENMEFVGMSISRDTCPANIRFEDCMACTGLKFNNSVAIYIDDTLDSILGLFSNTKYDKALEESKKVIESSDNKVFLGLNTTLKDLLISNNFMADFRKCFKIMEIPFHIDRESESLSIENILFLENALKCNIMETYVVKYTKEIDLSSIKRDYTLVSSAADQFKDLYLVGYDIADGEYVPRTTL